MSTPNLLEKDERVASSNVSTSTHETILSTTDRLEAQSVVSMLAAHGIEAQLEGVVDSARLAI